MPAKKAGTLTRNRRQKIQNQTLPLLEFAGGSVDYWACSAANRGRSAGIPTGFRAAPPRAADESIHFRRRIAGLTVAYWLRRDGFTPTIVERTHDPSPSHSAP